MSVNLLKLPHSKLTSIFLFLSCKIRHILNPVPATKEPTSVPSPESVRQTVSFAIDTNGVLPYFVKKRSLINGPSDSLSKPLNACSFVVWASLPSISPLTLVCAWRGNPKLMPIASTLESRCFPKKSIKICFVAKTGKIPVLFFKTFLVPLPVISSVERI